MTKRAEITWELRRQMGYAEGEIFGIDIRKMTDEEVERLSSALKTVNLVFQDIEAQIAVRYPPKPALKFSKSRSSKKNKKGKAND